MEAESWSTLTLKGCKCVTYHLHLQAVVVAECSNSRRVVLTGLSIKFKEGASRCRPSGSVPPNSHHGAKRHEKEEKKEREKADVEEADHNSYQKANARTLVTGGVKGKKQSLERVKNQAT